MPVRYPWKDKQLYSKVKHRSENKNQCQYNNTRRYYSLYFLRCYQSHFRYFHTYKLQIRISFLTFRIFLNEINNIYRFYIWLLYQLNVVFFILTTWYSKTSTSLQLKHCIPFVKQTNNFFVVIFQNILVCLIFWIEINSKKLPRDKWNYAQKLTKQVQQKKKVNKHHTRNQ